MPTPELLSEIKELKQLFEDEVSTFGPFAIVGPVSAADVDDLKTAIDEQDAGDKTAADTTTRIPAASATIDAATNTGAGHKLEAASENEVSESADTNSENSDLEESATRKTIAPLKQTATEEPIKNKREPRMKSRSTTIEDKLPADSVLRSMTTLEEVEKYVAGTVLIPLDEARTNPVFGVGDPEAELMVIGEAPGADEDEKGEPFVGRAGQLLNKILASIDFQREEVYIANILKSRPPKNRNPLPDEIKEHIPVLHKQIALVNPRMILCVGKVAANTLLENNSSLGGMRQKLHDLCGVPVVVTYHPAALLRNPNWKKPTWEDVKFLRAQFEEIGAAKSS